MKSATVAAAFLASVAVAQPHGHGRHLHPKRELVTEWETVWETATVIIEDDATQTIPPPAKPTSSGTPGQFFQAEAPSSSSSAAPVEYPTVATSQAQPQTTPTTTISLTTPTYPASSPVVPTTTSQAAPVQPTTTEQPATTEEPAAPTTSTYAASPPASSSGSSSGGGLSSLIPFNKEFSGEITYYNAALGACGYPDVGKDDTENIVAIPKQFWDNISTLTSYGLNQPAHPLCDKTITITSSDGKSTTTAKIRDRCDGCQGNAIDVTPHAFKELFGSLDGGRLDCSWTINE